MEVLTDSKSSTPVLLPNAEFMELLQTGVKDNKNRMANEKRKLRKKSKNRNNKDGDDTYDRKFKNKFEHRDWIQEHVLEYLKSTPCVNLPASKLKELKWKCMKGSSSSSTKKKRRSVSNGGGDPDISSPKPPPPPASKPTKSSSSSPGYGLTEAEAIQILNFMPQEPVEIHLMIENLHDRMSETKQGEFLEMIRSYNTSVEQTTSSDDKKKKNKGKNKNKNNNATTNGADEVVDDSIEMLEKAGNRALPLNDEGGDTAMKMNDEEGDTALKIKEEI
jgi:hypothetical protein